MVADTDLVLSLSALFGKTTVPGVPGMYVCPDAFGFSAFEDERHSSAP